MRAGLSEAVGAQHAGPQTLSGPDLRDEHPASGGWGGLAAPAPSPTVRTAAAARQPLPAGAAAARCPRASTALGAAGAAGNGRPKPVGPDSRTPQTRRPARGPPDSGRGRSPARSARPRTRRRPEGPRLRPASQAAAGANCLRQGWRARGAAV